MKSILLYFLQMWRCFCARLGIFKGSILFLRFAWAQLARKTGMAFAKMNGTLAWIDRAEKMTPTGLAHPVFLRPGSTDAATYYQVVEQGSYDVAFDHPQYIIDGGANIGLFGVVMKNRWQIR